VFKGSYFFALQKYVNKNKNARGEGEAREDKEGESEI
jgi:hypothetical protein